MLSMAPNIVFAPNIRRTQNTDTGRKTQTQLIIGFSLFKLFLKLLAMQCSQYLTLNPTCALSVYMRIPWAQLCITPLILNVDTSVKFLLFTITCTVNMSIFT